MYKKKNRIKTGSKIGSYKYTNKYVQKYIFKMYVQNICNKKINAGKQLGMFLEQILLLFSFQSFLTITVDHITVADQGHLTF